MEKKNKATIEKIYVCRTVENNLDLIEKILIQYSNGNFSYFKLLVCDDINEQTKIKDKLDSYVKKLLEQDNINDVSETNKIITVDYNNEELKQFVDEQIKNIEYKSIKMDESMYTFFGLFSLSIANWAIINTNMMMHKSLINVFCSLFNSFLSVFNFNKVINCNKKRKMFEDEKQHNIRFKFLFSYFMIIFNIGINAISLNLNSDKIKNEIALLKHSSLEIDNPFSDNLLDVSNEEAVDLILDALENNTLLNKEDLEIALSLEEAIEDNPYLDYEKLYKNFATIGVMHYENMNNGVIAADYNSLTNSINMYSGSYSSSECYTDCLSHEFFHSMGKIENTLLNEGMTSLLQMEYSNDITVNDMYYDHVLFAKIFCELITPEKMLEAYTKNDTSIIKNEMLKLCDDEVLYNDLMKAMSEYSKNYKDVHDLLIKQLSKTDKNSPRVHPSIDFYLLFKPFLYSDLITDETREQVTRYIDNIGFWVDVCDKVYFNKRISIIDSDYNYECEEDGPKIYVISP